MSQKCVLSALGYAGRLTSASVDRNPPPPRGWYRHPSGALRYWNGRSWAPLPPPRSADEVDTGRTPIDPDEVFRIAILVLGWLATAISLGMLLHGVEAGGADCGTVFGHDAAVADYDCEVAFGSRLRAAVGTAGLAGMLFLTGFAIGRQDS